MKQDPKALREAQAAFAQAEDALDEIAELLPDVIETLGMEETIAVLTRMVAATADCEGEA